MRLIHCSDLHLDSGMDSGLPAALARERRAEILGTFSRMVEWAKTNKVDALLICGDLFDGSRVSAAAAELVMDVMENAAGVEFYCLRGNHDEGRDLFCGRKLPGNVHTFGESWTYYRLGDVVIAGIEPEDWNALYGTLALPEDTVNIVVLHGQNAAHPGPELISIPDLRGRNIDYLALGHIHSHRQQKLDDRGSWCYCGCLEGRGFDECGEKGFVLADIDGGRVETAFVPFASRQLREAVTDISGCVTITQLCSAMETAAAGISPDSLVKFTLTGTYTPQTQKDLDYLTKYFAQRFCFVKIRDDSRFRIERGAYEHDISLKGEFIRMVMASDRSEEDKGRIICAGLQALAGEAVVL